MGKTSKWLRMLLGGKRDHNNKHSPPSEKKQEPVVVDAQAKEKRRWSFSRHSMKERHRNEEVEEEGGWVGKYERHALAVAAADAAIAAAQAAAAAVHLAASPRPSVYENMAAITIQTTFRGYLARRALKALKGVVKLQALVRGYLVRKRADATLSCMQSLIRVQTRARANRLFTSDAGRVILHHHHFLKSKAANNDHATRKSMDGWNFGNESGAYTQSSRRGSLYLSQQEHERSLEENAKVVEVDTYSSRAKRNNNNWKRRYINNTTSDSGSAETSSLPNAFSTSTLHSYSPASVSDEVAVPQDYSPLTVSSSDCWAFGNFRKEYLLHPEDCRPSTANNSPRLLSRLGMGLGFNTGGGGLTPPNVGGFPSYMSYTESSKAKVRSQSAPRQRGEKNATPCRKKTPSPSHAHTPPPLLDSRASFSGFNVPRSPFVQLQPENKGTAPPAVYNGKVEGPTMSFRDTTCGRFSHNW